MLVLFGSVSNSVKVARVSIPARVKALFCRSSSTQTNAGRPGADVPTKPRTRPFSSQLHPTMIPPSETFLVNSAFNLKVFDEDNNFKNTNSSVSAPANIAQELTLAELASLSSKDRVECDKIIILLRHGEAFHNTFYREHTPSIDTDIERSVGLHQDCPRDPMLTGVGCGQALNISRAMDVYCNSSTKLIPDLVVTSPLRRATQTALMGLSRYHPMTSFKRIPWICHASVAEKARHLCDIMASPEELALEFPGIDYSLYKVMYETVNEQDLIDSPISAQENHTNLVRRAGNFLRWIKERDEHVIVVATHSLWLDAFKDYALNMPITPTVPYSPGEVRAIALKWS